MPSPAKGIRRGNPAVGYRYGRPEISKADRQETFLLQRQKFMAILELIRHPLPIVGFPETWARRVQASPRLMINMGRIQLAVTASERYANRR